MIFSKISSKGRRTRKRRDDYLNWKLKIDPTNIFSQNQISSDKEKRNDRLRKCPCGVGAMPKCLLLKDLIVDRLLKVDLKALKVDNF